VPSTERGLPHVLRLYFHPFASFCQKAASSPSTRTTSPSSRTSSTSRRGVQRRVQEDLADRKVPRVAGRRKDLTIPESSIIIELPRAHYPVNASSSPRTRTSRGRRACAIASTIST